MSPIYKVCCVVTGAEHPGAILNLEQQPAIGEKIRLGKHEFEVVEVVELMPPRGGFHFLHATLRPPGK